MQRATKWLDRIRERIREAREAAQSALPGFVETIDIETEKSLARAQMLVVRRSEIERMIAGGEAPADLKNDFSVPFGETIFVSDEPAAVPGERGEGLRAVLVTDELGSYRVCAWFEERRAQVQPRYDFALTPGVEPEGAEGRIANLLYWLAAYVSSPGLLAIRHNPSHESVRRHRTLGRPAPGSYYTFQQVEEPRRSPVRRKLGEPVLRTASVHGHFRRAHWHRLPQGRGMAWYPTTWVRPYRRRVPAAETASEVGAAA